MVELISEIHRRNGGASLKQASIIKYYLFCLYLTSSNIPIRTTKMGNQPARMYDADDFISIDLGPLDLSESTSLIQEEEQTIKSVLIDSLRIITIALFVLVVVLLLYL